MSNDYPQAPAPQPVQPMQPYPPAPPAAAYPQPAVGYPSQPAQPPQPPQPPQPQPVAAQWGQPISGAYIPQQGAYPAGFGQMPAEPAPSQASHLMQPQFWVAKLPLIALVVWIGFALTGLVTFIYYLAQSGYGVSVGTKVFYAFFGASNFGLIPWLAIGTAVFVALMALARIVGQLAASDPTDEKKA